MAGIVVIHPLPRKRKKKQRTCPDCAGQGGWCNRCKGRKVI